MVGDLDAASENWHFRGPFEKMTFASRMQHKIYWGPLKKPIEWSLKTVLAPWSYLASVFYHDTIWYPFIGEKRVKAALASDWGRLFRNWETLTPDEQGFPTVGKETLELQRTRRVRLSPVVRRPRHCRQGSARVRRQPAKGGCRQVKQ